MFSGAVSVAPVALERRGAVHERDVRRGDAVTAGLGLSGIAD